MSNPLRDVRYALRGIRKSPGFTLLAVLTLALGIGASTAIFTLLDQVALRMLPVKDPASLALLRWEGSWRGSNTGYAAWSYPWYEDLRDKNDVFEEVFCRYDMPLSFGYGGQTERIGGELVSGNYFRTLGIGAALGRTITADDDQKFAGRPVAVLSHDFWRNRFDSDRDIVGKQVQLNGHAFDIIGVAQRGFRGVEFSSTPHVFLPTAMKMELSPGWNANYDLEKRRNRWVNVFGRLKPGVTLERANAAMQPLFHSLLEYDIAQPEFSSADTYARERYLEANIEVLPGGQGPRNIRETLESPLWVLMAMVALLLAIACVNIANLLMTRAAARQKEVAVRLALGASRGQIIRQLLIESLLLGAAGGAAGLVLATWTSRLLVSLMPTGDAPPPITTTPDTRILLFALAVSMVTALLFGMAPALQSIRVRLAPTLKDQAGSIAGGHFRVRKALVAVQVFLSLVLLIGAGLFVQSLRNLRNLDTGFETEQTLVFGLDPMRNGYTMERNRLFLRQLREKLATLPGAEGAGVALVRVLSGNEWDNSVTVQGYEAKPGENMNPFYNAVSQGYFQTLEIPMLEGRDFRDTDVDGAPKVGIVNQAFVKYYFGDQPAVGRRFGFGREADIEIVGVIPDVRYQNMRQEIPRQVFVPYDQANGASEAHVYLRTRHEPDAMIAATREAVRGLDANVPLYALRPMQVQLEDSLVTERLIAFLAGAFGVVATLLSAIGLYGVLAYGVTRRTREIGLRMALGAQRGDVAGLVLKEMAWLFVAGAIVAIPVSYGLATVVRAQLYGIEPQDPFNIVAATLALAAVAIAAGCIPAWRASRIQPMEALRFE